MTLIGRGAFFGCTGLTSIKIPDNVTEIGDWAFEGCTGLTSIKIPNNVTEIGEWVFENCTGLTSIEIPSSVTQIGEDAFKNCMNLYSITFHHKNPNDFFEFICNISSSTEIHVPIGSGYAYRHHKYFAKFEKIIGDVK